MEKTDILIIGAGVIGLAVAAELSHKFKHCSIILMERYGKYGREISSRNSEVIHAGIYYPAESMKARLCVEGKNLLYDFCRRWNVPFKRCGKLIIAQNVDDIPSLEKLFSQAENNGVQDLEFLDAGQVAQLEPNVQARAALLSPSTGIIDSHQLMARLEWLARQNGVFPAYCHHVTDVKQTNNGFLVHYLNPDKTSDLIECSRLINCAGLEAGTIASLAGIDVIKAGFKIHLCKGEYFSISHQKSKLISRLVYPPPLEDLKGLGIHITKTLDGRIRLGPNAFYIEEIDYQVNPAHRMDFYHAVKSFLPFLEPSDLAPEMAGIRPKLSGPGEPFRDFVIKHEADRNLQGLINLLGIESPGLTCCLSIARTVTALIR